MTRLVAIPNVSEGRDDDRVASLARALSSGGVRILDVHSDAVHNRTVFTVATESARLVDAMVALAAACKHAIDLTEQHGLHPRLGALDVCPFVPHDGTMAEAVAAAHRTGDAIAADVGLPVYFYGDAALREATRELPDLRRGGLQRLIRRARSELPPDRGPEAIDPASGVVCVGARRALIAFNVWLRTDAAGAAEIAQAVRTSGGGPAGVRALGIPFDGGLAQVSMNLIDPSATNIDEAFEVVARRATERDIEIVRTEIVGLVPERYLPNPDAQAARLLVEPGRSLESALTQDDR